ncbi:hypothetical protein AAE02nite_26000 [Adhaeribacter aerolatus]|uniref:VanZ-like domain-containing protein n=1 Tax=Adhaeribacter aerolatus TaxID=670289 RepID=A0A512AZ19_9BACT|nr:VanZ family protein [Adhaeribacter aerolatus]GEO04936.1 hypothetical protein AAE02nite_26000 [Adhaeribacter aerolatus]
MNLQKKRRYSSDVNNVTNRLTTVLFIIYIIALAWILLFKLGVQFSYMEKRNVNLIPFGELFLNGKIDAGENLMNVVIFVPLGMYVGVLFSSWRSGKKFFFIFLMSLIVEGLQFIMAVGAFDITDLFTNTLGGIIGWMIFKATEKIFGDRFKAQKFINLIAGLATALVILLLFLLKMNLLPIRYQ